jgi:hypothetical protein
MIGPCENIDGHRSRGQTSLSSDHQEKDHQWPKGDFTEETARFIPCQSPSDHLSIGEHL